MCDLGWRVLRWFGDQQGRGGDQGELPAHCGGHTRQDPRPRQVQEARPQEPQAFRPRRVRQDARTAR